MEIRTASPVQSRSLPSGHTGHQGIQLQILKKYSFMETLMTGQGRLRRMTNLQRPRAPRQRALERVAEQLSQRREALGQATIRVYLHHPLHWGAHRTPLQWLLSC
jgi:hypothetical protein